MRRVVCGLIAVLMFGTALWGLAVFRTVPILMYHHIDERPQPKTHQVSPQVFERQMRWLKQWGLRVLSFDEFLKYKRQGRRCPLNSVVLTFDDGYEDNFTHAVPILKRYGHPAMFFVAAGDIGRKGFMSWDHIKAMADEGFGFGNHGLRQRYLPDLSPRQRRIEVRLGEMILERHLNQPVLVYAYPIGGFTQEIKKELAAWGYAAAVTTNRGRDRFNHDLYELNRIKVTERDRNPVFFAAKISGFYNLFRRLKPSH